MRAPVLEGENIIAFAKDWSYDPTSPNHVMRGLAQRNRVLWLNSISTRTPQLGSTSDLGTLARKVRDFSKGPVEVEPNLFVYTPIVLPFPHLPAAAAVNRGILRTTLAALRRKLDMERFQLWTFIPTALPYLGMPGEELSVYYCIDDWASFNQVDGQRIGEMEWELCRRSDVVFATAEELRERRLALNPETHLALHGVDHEHFARALDDSTTVPDDLADCSGPVVGFFGLLQDWIDLSLLAHVAERRPDWTVAVIGASKVDVSSLERLPNVRLLGRRPYEELPRYSKAFSVGVMPFVVNELTKNVNPIKMREYLSAGLPVVSTDLPEARGYPEWVQVAHTPDEFLAACEKAIAEDSPEMRRRRSEAMLSETWDAKVAELGVHVRSAQARRHAQSNGGAPKRRKETSRRRETGPIITVVGGRPNFMKAAPVHAAFTRAGVDHQIIHTGQHYDEAMSKVFFEDLGMPRPVVNLGVGSGSHAEQTAAVMVGLERYFAEHQPRAVLVVGDVNSTLAASLVAAKQEIFLGHVEAGLRSGDWSMPEEVNRVVTDSVSDLLLTPSPDADRNLLAEGCAPESIALVGNVMIDTLLQHLPRARELDVPTRMGVAPGEYAVLTMHRPSNVDDPRVLGGMLDAIARIADRLPVVFPVHPRTRKNIEALGTSFDERNGVVLSDPLGYLDFLSLTSRARLVLTDSGGLQEESTVLGIPCLTLRENTERPITIDEGTNVLVGTDPEAIVREAERALANGDGRHGRVPALWDGRTAERIVEAVTSRLGAVRAP